MKIMKYIMPLLLIACMFASCDTDVENATVVGPTTYGPQYYKNLRDYKKSDHSIAWGWFADYTQSTSLATRFLGLPDSLDICSLWGGIPSDDSTHVDTHYLPEVYREMKYVQEVKGTRLVVPSIIRIRTRPEFYDSIWVKQNDPQAAMRAYAQDLLRPIFENGLDGIDMDYEPEGDPLTGSNLDYFVEYVGQFVGPMASPDSTFTYPDGFTIKGNPNILLCIDYYNSAPGSNTNKFTNWYVNQTYGGSPGRVPFSGCPTEKVVYTENVGDNWKAAECGQLLNYARYQPSTGRKGGFGAFFMHRDYINTGYGCSNYANMRHGIQIQNPAIH